MTVKRVDSHRLFPLAKKRGGIAVEITGGPARKASELNRQVLGLVRPVRIDAFRLGDAALNEEMEVPKTLEEGEGVRGFLWRKGVASRLELHGEIWSRPYRQVVSTSKSFSRDAAAFIFPFDMYRDLSDEEMLRVARKGRAVSPVTSYLSIEPGVRPSTAGIDRVMRGTGGGRWKRGRLWHGRIWLGQSPAAIAEKNTSTSGSALRCEEQATKGLAC